MKIKIETECGETTCGECLAQYVVYDIDGCSEHRCSVFNIHVSSESESGELLRLPECIDKFGITDQYGNDDWKPISEFPIPEENGDLFTHWH